MELMELEGPGRWSTVTLSRLGAVNSSESLITLQWKYNWIDEVDSD